MKQFLLLLFVPFTALGLVITLPGCRKEEPIDYDNYPNRLTCKINGEPWEPQGTDGPFGAPYFNVEYYAETRFLRVFARNNLNKQVLYLGIDSLQVNENNFRPIDVVWRDWLHPNDACDEFRFDTMNENKFFLDNIDYEHRIIKGRFYFTVVNDCGEKLAFLDGMLDVKPVWYD